MAGKTLTRMDLSEAVFREVGLSRNESAGLVERVLELMSDSLVEGEQVKISSFGTFSVRSKTARVGRNPKTGEEALSYNSSSDKRGNSFFNSGIVIALTSPT